MVRSTRPLRKKICWFIIPNFMFNDSSRQITYNLRLFSSLFKIRLNFKYRFEVLDTTPNVWHTYRNRSVYYLSEFPTQLRLDALCFVLSGVRGRLKIKETNPTNKMTPSDGDCQLFFCRRLTRWRVIILIKFNILLVLCSPSPSNEQRN